MRLPPTALGLLVLGATTTHAVVLGVDMGGSGYAVVSASGVNPVPPGLVVRETTMRRQNADGSQEILVTAGSDQSLHFGIGFTELFAGAAEARGYVRAKGRVVHLTTSALAGLSALRVDLGKNPLVAWSVIRVGATVTEIVVPKPATGQPLGSPTSITIYPVITYDVTGSLQFSVFELNNGVSVQLGVYTLDDELIDFVNSPYGAVAYRTINGLTSGTPVVVKFTANISSGAMAGNDLPLVGASHPYTIRVDLAEVDALNTAYMRILDANGDGIVGESGIDYGDVPVEETVTTTTSTTTSTTFVPPTTLPGCAATALCGDGAYQPECGEACDCPRTTGGEVRAACGAGEALPAPAESCAVCAGCQIDLRPCASGSTTTTTAPGAESTTTTSAPGTTATTTTLLPRPAEVCNDCRDNDANDRVDREDVACCGPTPQPLALRRARLVPGKRLAFDVALPGAAAVIGDLASGGFALQLRAQDGAELLCLRLPALAKKGKRFVFRDASGARAGGITAASLRSARADAILHVEGRKVTLAGSAQPALELTVGFADGTPGRCGSIRQTLRRQGRQALTFP